MSSLWLDGGILRGYYGEGGDIVLPDFVYDVGGYVFRNHTGIKSVTIPDGALDVGYGAFSGCEGLIKVVLPDSIQRIDMYAFSGCKRLPEIRLPSKLKILRDSTFIHCASLRRVHIPEGVEKIEFHAFFGCDSLTEIRALGVTEVEDPMIDRTCKCILPKVPLQKLDSTAMKRNGTLGYCSYPSLYGETGTEYAEYAHANCNVLVEDAIRCGFSEPLRYFYKEGLLTPEKLSGYIELSQQYKNTEVTAFLLECGAGETREQFWSAFEKEFEL